MTSSGKIKIKSWQKVVNVDENTFSARHKEWEHQDILEWEQKEWEHQYILGSKTLYLKIGKVYRFYCLFKTFIDENFIEFLRANS